MTDVLFVCLHNAGRSQMAEAMFEAAAPPGHSASSAGSRARPDGSVHPEVIEAMKEVGIDLSHRRPKMLSPALASKADIVVTMGCGDECPLIPGKEYMDWSLPDPKGEEIDAVRLIRDRIAQLVEELIRGLDE